MGTLGKVTVRMPYVTDMPRDVSINDWWFYSEDSAHGSDDLISAVGDPLKAFYEDATDSAFGAVGAYLAGYLHNQTTARFAIVDQATGHETADVQEGDFALLPSRLSSTQLPAEVACCLSYRAEPVAGVTGRHKASLRGRVYLGPFNADVQINAADTRPSINPHFITVVKEAHIRLLDALVSDLGVRVFAHVIYSRHRHEPHDVTWGWVDNEWDTQRRRSNLATARTQWPRP